ncbi:MAG TPA: response regulator transcription factor [Ktedonobacterales bacterium]|nr:response regulator transcription factor [Ktedonobacterales bacterium]
MSVPIRVILADDQRLLRDGLRIILNAAPDIDVIAVGEDGEEAILLADKYLPDVMLLDIRMPRCDGLEAARRILAQHPQIHIALLTTFDQPELVSEAARVGALGYILKDMSAEELCAAVRTIARGQPLYQGQSAAHLLASLGSASAPIGPNLLTERELEVLRHIARGRSNAEIATELVVSDATVKTHINHIFAKLGARDRAHAIVLAQEHHLI